MKRSLALVAVLFAAVLVPWAGPAGPPAGAAPLPDPAALGPTPYDVTEVDLGSTAYRYAGFPAPMEVVGRVFAPTSISTPAPLVLLLHGRHATCATGPGPDDVLLTWPCPAGSTSIPSYRGYDDLARVLASHGYIVESVSANAINAADGYVEDGGADARAHLLMHHLDLWKQWNAGSGGPFGSRYVGKVDLGRVGLMGHSRGGEGVVEAAIRNQLLGSPYGIKAVVPLAPVDFGARLLSSVPMSVVLGACDGDVSDLQGAQYYDDARYRLDEDQAPKQIALIYGANHNYFNSVWTSGSAGAADDWSYFGASDPSCSKGTASRLTAPQQRQAGTSVMAAFLRRFVGGEAQFEPFVTGAATPPLPVQRVAYAYHAPAADRLDVNRYAGPAAAQTNDLGGATWVSARGAGDVCAPTGPVPCTSGEMYDVDQGASRLDVSWTKPTTVVVNRVPAGRRDLSAYDGVRFRATVSGDARNLARAAQDGTVTLVDAAGRRGSARIGAFSTALARPPGVASAKSVLLGVHIPFSALSATGGSVDLAAVTSIEVAFDRSTAGDVGVADLAVTREGTGGLWSGRGPLATSTSAASCRTATWDLTRFVCTTLQALLGRDPSDAELASGRRLGATAAGRAAFAAVVAKGPEHLQRRQDQLGQDILGTDYGMRPPVGVRGLEDQVEELIAFSLQYTPAVSGDEGRLVDIAYRVTLRRLPTAAQRSGWVARLEANGAQTYNLAVYLVRSAEHMGLVVDDQYRQLLGRPPTAAVRARWVARLVQGTIGEPDLTAYLAGSPEAFQKA